MIIFDSRLVLLTNLLLDSLKRSSPSRVVIVSSKLHDPGTRHGNPPNFKWNLDEINNEMGYNGMVAYKNSKLANVWFAYELARRLENTGVDVHVLCPVLIEILCFSVLRYMIDVFLGFRSNDRSE
jgi:NAD(P)-dependent dehydrogenase (short-subunit alcohol dehydrogenase family)